MPPVSKPAPGFPLTPARVLEPLKPRRLRWKFKTNWRRQKRATRPEQKRSGNPIHFTGCFTTRASRLVWDIAVVPLAVLFSAPSMA
jgi:hypothetical protein